MTAIHFCVIFGVLFLVFMGLVAKNMIRFMDLSSCDSLEDGIVQAKKRMASHAFYGVLASMSGLGLFVSLVFAVIDYVKQ